MINKSELINIKFIKKSCQVYQALNLRWIILKIGGRIKEQVKNIVVIFNHTKDNIIYLAIGNYHMI